MSRPLTPVEVARYHRRMAHRAHYCGRTREGCYPSVTEAELRALAAEHAPRLLEDPWWLSEHSNISRLDWLASEMLRLDRQDQARQEGFREANHRHAHRDEYPWLSSSQLLTRRREIPFPNVGVVVAAILAHRVAWVSGRLLDPPNRHGYRTHLQYFIRWRDKTVFDIDLTEEELFES